MKNAIYPGSFDPVTLGHLDIIRRSSRLVDHLIVGVLNNNTKTPLFSVDERVNMLKDVTKDIDNVEILSFRGLLVDFAKEHQVKTIFFEELVSPKVAKTIAKETGANAKMLNPLEGLSNKKIKAGEDYFSVMKQNLAAIKEALSE